MNAAYRSRSAGEPHDMSGHSSREKGVSDDRYPLGGGFTPSRRGYDHVVTVSLRPS